MAETAKYDAFISYRHLDFDKKVAVKLQKQLESYTPPKSVAAKGDFRHFRVFRDETELATSNSLSDSIREALRHTRYLIVVCSAGTRESRWCLEEITYFKELHGGSTKNIRVIVIEGDPVQVLPAELLTEQRTIVDEDGNEHSETVDVEPLALNIVADSQQKSLKKLDVEYIRIAATLLGHDFEDLFQRNQRRLFRRTVTVAAAVGALLLGIIVYGSVLLVYANRQRALAEENAGIARQQEALANQSLAEAKSLMASAALDHAAALNDAGARTRAGALLNELYPKLDPAWDNHDELLVKFRDATMNAIYYSAGAVYTSVDMNEQVSGLVLSEDEGTALLVAGRRLLLLDIATGQVLRTQLPPPSDLFTSACFAGGKVVAGLHSGGLLCFDPAPEGEAALLESVCGNAVEAVGYLPQNGAVTVVSAQMRDGEFVEDITLTMLPTDADGLPDPGAKQAFALESDARGDISVRYSFSQNGRYLAAKHNLQRVVENGNRHYETIDKTVAVLDAAAFAPGQSQAENQAAMLHTVDWEPWDPEDIWVVARYQVDNGGLLTLDMQTVLYDGSEEMGYLLGYSTAEQRREQLITVVEVSGGEVLFQGNILGEGYSYDSSFLPVQDNMGYLAYYRYNKESGLCEVSTYSLLEPNPDKALYTCTLPLYSYADKWAAATVSRGHNDWPPVYLLALETLDGSSTLFHIKNYEHTELAGGNGAPRAIAAGALDDSLFLVGYVGGVANLHSLSPSAVAGEGAVQVVYGEVWRGEEAGGVMLEHYQSGDRLVPLAYNHDRSQVFGFLSALPSEAEKEAAVTPSRQGHYIWSTGDGAALRRLDFLGTEQVSRTSISLDADLSWAVVCSTSHTPRFSATYTWYNLADGAETFRYVTEEEYQYFGIERDENELWFLTAGTGVLEVWDVRAETILQREYVRGMAIRQVSDYVWYHPDRNYIILNSSVYSFVSGKEVFRLDTIRSANTDCTTVYLDTGAAVSLLPGDLRAQLAAWPLLGPAAAEDAAATGLEMI